MRGRWCRLLLVEIVVVVVALGWRDKLVGLGGLQLKAPKGRVMKGR